VAPHTTVTLEKPLLRFRTPSAQPVALDYQI
jgi:hypothetical protein